MALAPVIVRHPPRLRPPGGAVRKLLACPARLVDRLAHVAEPPRVSLAERHRRLTAADPPPEGWFALQPGLATVGDEHEWTSFAARGATALAVGGVHGVDRVAAFARFRDETRALGYARQAVYPVREPDLDAAHAAGFATLPVAVEAWVDLDGFTMRGKRFADLRQMRNRAVRHGIVVEEASAVWRPAIEATWQAFLAARPDPWEIRWLSGSPQLDAPWGRRTYVAHRDGVVQAFCTVLPGPDGVRSLDVMCRHPDALPGAMEGLLVAVLRRLQAEGVLHVSLGPCPLAGGTAEAIPGPLGWLARRAFHGALGDRWFGFARLAAFKDKLRPRYEVVHLGLAPRISWLGLYLAARIWALGD